MDTTSTILRQARHTTTAWEQGAGQTQEVVRHPAEGPLDWQIRFDQIKDEASVAIDPELERRVVLVEGTSLELAAGGPLETDAGDATRVVLEPEEPHHLAGQGPITVTPSGRARTLALVTRRGRCTGEMGIHRLGTPLEVQLGAGEEVWVAVLAGWLKVERDLLGPADVFRVGQPMTLSGDSNAVVAVMTITGADGEQRAAR